MRLVGCASSQQMGNRWKIGIVNVFLPIGYQGFIYDKVYIARNVSYILKRYTSDVKITARKNVETTNWAQPLAPTIRA